MPGGPGDSVSVSVLGSPRVERDGKPVVFDTRKAIALLGFLALTDRPQRRETLAALLWPDADDTRARSALRRTLSVVRKELGDAVAVTRDEVELLDGEQVDVDVRAFLAGVGSEDLDEVAAAASRWRGDLLAGFGLRDSPDFDDWQAREAERLRRAMSSACARLVERQAAGGQLDEAVAQAERWLDLDPLHEPAHRALMHLHAARGDRAAAIQQYRSCVRIVDEQLGVPPLAETTALYDVITTGDVPPVPAGWAAPLASTTPDGTPPIGIYPLVGRDEDLGRVLAAVGPGAVVVIDGEPGVGKTRLVDEVLARLESPALVARCYDSDGDVPYAPLIELLRLASTRASSAAVLAELPAPIRREMARLLPELAQGDPFDPPDGGPGAEARFVDGLARAVWAAGAAPPGIVVIDDVHWADHATQQVLAHLLLRGGDGGPCLVLTHRTGEVGDAGPLFRALAERLRASEAVGVRLGRLAPEAVGTLVARVVADEDVPDGEVARITEEVIADSEGLAFLVVARLDALAGGGDPVGDLGDLMRGRLASLSDEATQVLTTASVIGRSFTFDVLRAASGRSDDEAVAGLDELVARGLVEERATVEAPTYDFAHGQVRQLVYDETSLARRRLLHQRVADALLVAGGPDAPAARAAAVAHHERHAGRDDLAAEHFRQAGDHARAVYANTEARSHYEAALALGHPAVAALHEAVADLETLDGRFTDAVATLELAASRSDPGGLARIEGKLGSLHQRLGHWSTAEQHYQDALRALGDDGSRADRARLSADLAITAHRQGDAERAARLADRALALAERSGDEPALTYAGTVGGLLAVGRGDLAVAREQLGASLEAAERLGDPAARAAAANGLARVERLDGRPDEAHRLLVEALDLCVSIGDRHREAALRDQLAEVLHAEGRHEEAMAELKAAVAIFADIGVDAGSVQTEVWRLTEWVDHSTPGRNDPGTTPRENARVAQDDPGTGD